MESTVKSAADQGATAGFANESASDFAFPAEPAAQPAAAQATQNAGQKGAGAVDAQRSADARGNEPRRDFAPRFNRPQKDIGKAFDKESERVQTKAQREYEEKLATDPYRKIATRMVKDVIRSEGLNEEQAIQKIDNGFFEAVAERDNVSPAIARMLYESEMRAAQQKNPDQDAKSAQNQQQQQSQIDVEEEASSIIDELLSMKMPEGFDLAAASKDSAFADLLAEYPTEAAVRIYHAEQRAQSAASAADAAPQQLADKLRARAEVPQSSRSSLVPGPPNFKTMTSKEYKQYQKDNHLV